MIPRLLPGCLLLSLPTRAQKPQLSFFTELPTAQLSSLFADSSVIPALRTLKAALRMGMLDFTPERARIVRQLNQRGVPVVAWLLLPEQQGYWFNVTNGGAAGQRYAELRRWTQANNLRWAGIGIDLEPAIDDIKRLRRSPTAALWRAYGRLFDRTSLAKGAADYGRVIAQIRADGYPIESYIFPFMLDERAAGTTAFQRATGMLDLAVDTEIPMLYTSFLGPDGAGYIPAYGRTAKAIALGNTGGGVQIAGSAPGPSLTWPELERDVLLASKLTNQIHIFCLESCVQKGYLSRLIGFDYSRAAPHVAASVTKVTQTRSRIRTYLTVLDHPVLLTLGFALGVLLIVGLLMWFIIWLVRTIRPTRA